MQITSQELAEILQLEIPKNFTFSSISTDSRTLQAGELFIAFKRVQDGNQYVLEAQTKGAVAAITTETTAGVPENFCIVVPDTIKAFEVIAVRFRKSFHHPVVGVTGSAGKTSTKEAIKTVLSHFGNTYATFKTDNNRYGVPANVSKLDNDTQKYAVLEIGLSGKGWIRREARMVQPDIAVITSVFPNMHIKYFREPTDESVARAKAEIFELTNPQGYAIINADTHKADLLVAQAKACNIEHICTFGRNGDSVKLLDFQCTSINHTEVQVELKGKTYNYSLSEAGEHKVYASLAVLSVTEALGLDREEVLGYLPEIHAFEKRCVFYRCKLPSGGSFTLLDDSYSGWYDAWKMTLQLAELLPSQDVKRRLAVVGNMVDLGDQTEHDHRLLGQLLDQAHLDSIMAVGADMQYALEEIHSKPTEYHENSEDLGQQLLEQKLQPGDLLIVKGSHFSSWVCKVCEYLLTHCPNQRLS